VQVVIKRKNLDGTRLGILVPSGNLAMEPEFGLVTPEGVSCHYHRSNFSGAGGDDEEVVARLKKAEAYVADAAALIIKLAQGELTNEEIYSAGGHGALVIRGDEHRPFVATTGPRQDVMAGSSLQLHRAYPPW
jgi:maleate cis-trans isomerase